jgi:hypothetical protein
VKTSAAESTDVHRISQRRRVSRSRQDEIRWRVLVIDVDVPAFQDAQDVLGDGRQTSFFFDGVEIVVAVTLEQVAQDGFVSRIPIVERPHRDGIAQDSGAVSSSSPLLTSIGLSGA